MTHGLWNLMNHPELWAAWRADPSLTPTAVEEVMRTSAVTMHFRRTATRDVELAGKQISEGDKVAMWFNSANHDEDAFERPFRFDLARAWNEHMTFGRSGPHFCLGRLAGPDGNPRRVRGAVQAGRPLRTGRPDRPPSLQLHRRHQTPPGPPGLPGRVVVGRRVAARERVR